jgi:hypothetical protein
MMPSYLDHIGGRVALVAALIALPSSPRAAEAQGFVDGSIFKEIAGEQAVTVEVSIGKNLLRAFAPAAQDLKDLILGLDSIHAVILDLGEVPDPAGKLRRARERIVEMDERLKGRGWERLALVREGSETVRVLVLPAQDKIQGLVVMAADDEEVVFVNVAGVIDLARLGEIGEAFQVPGLDALDRGKKRGRAE